jgi:hypothetical protein
MGIRQVPPTIKDPNLAGFLRELRAAIGGVSDQVTKIIATRSSSGGGSPGPVDPGTNPPGPTPGGDGYPPPAPLSLEAVPGAFSVTLVWTNPDIPDLQATEVWAQRSFDAWNATYEYLANAKALVNGTVYRSRKAQSVNSTTNVVTLNKNFPPATSPEWWEATTLAPTEKSYVGESAGTSWIHDGLTPGETWAYWVRNRDIENLFSTYFPNDDVGIVTTTLLDPGAYLALLTNSITATQLYSDLGKRINLIDGPLTIQPSCSIPGHTTEAACVAAGGTWNPGSVAYRVAEEASARAAGLAAEALARETGITNEATIRQTKDEQLAQTISIVNAKADNAAAAVISEQTARVDADGALGQRIDAVVATANGNTAAITSEATARASADGALSTRIDTVVATTNNNTAAIQTETTARTTADSALSSRIDVVVAKANSNAAAISSEATTRANADGALGQRIDQVQAVGNDNSALITDINQSKIGYCTIGTRTSEHGTRIACEAAGGTWNIGLPWATAVKQVSVTANNGQTASLQQQFEAIYGAGGLRAQYTVKIDNAGWISGFGLSSETQSDGTVISDFGVRADRFWIAAPNTPFSGTGGPGTKLVDLAGGNRQVIRLEYIYADFYGTPTTFRIAYIQLEAAGGQSLKTLSGLDNYNPFTSTTNPNRSRWVTLRNIRSSVSGSLLDAWNQAFIPTAAGNFYWTDYRYGTTVYASSLPGVTDASRLIVLAVDSGLPTTAAGYTVATTDTTNDPAKLVADSLLPFVVTTTARTYNGITINPGVYMNSAWIVDASITNAKIYGHICSDNFVAGGGNVDTPHTIPGNAGWCINKNGYGVLNEVVFRGNLASTVSGSPTFDSAGNITSYGTAGWAITKAGNAVFNTVVVRSGANVGNNALVQASIATDTNPSNDSTNNGTKYRYLTSYAVKTGYGKTAGFMFSLDMDAATSYTTKVEVVFSGAFSHTWVAYYKGGSTIGARFFSATTAHNPVIYGSTLNMRVNVTNNGTNGSFGDCRMSILEITG